MTHVPEVLAKGRRVCWRVSHKEVELRWRRNPFALSLVWRFRAPDVAAETVLAQALTSTV